MQYIHLWTKWFFIESGIFDPQALFVNEINFIDQSIKKHMEANVCIFYKKLPEEVKKMPYSKMKEAYILILYYNKHQQAQQPKW